MQLVAVPHCSHLAFRHSIFYELLRSFCKCEIWVKRLQGDLLDELHRQGTIQQEEFAATGTLVAASVPASLANRLGPLLLDASRYERESAELQAQTG